MNENPTGPWTEWYQVGPSNQPLVFLEAHPQDLCFPVDYSARLHVPGSGFQERLLLTVVRGETGVSLSLNYGLGGINYTQLQNWYLHELPALFSEAGVHSPSLPCPVPWIDTQAGESGLSVLALPPGAIGKLFERQVSGCQLLPLPK